MMQRIPMNIRRINFFSFGDRCNATNPFYSFARIYRLSSRNHFHHRAQRALRAQHLLKQCPTPTANRGRHVHRADHYISNAPPRSQTEADTRTAQAIMIEVAPAESRSAGCGARRKAVRLSGRRHGVAPWASVKLPLRPANPSKAQPAQAFPRECPSREAQAQAYPEASQPNPRPRSPSKARVYPWWSTSWAKVQQAQAFLQAYPSREVQARACPEASRPSLRPRNPSKARVLPAYRRPWANRPVVRWRRASFCRAARSSRRGPSQRGRDECATRGGTPRAPA